MLNGGFRIEGLGAHVVGKFRVGAALFFVAMALRLIGLNWGLPTQAHWYSYHPDEAQMLGAIASLDFFGGDFNPNFFNYPSLYIYLAAFVHLLASGLGLARPLANDPMQSWMFAHDVLFCARVVTAVLGAATAPLVYGIARHFNHRGGGEKIGILAGLLMAFLPGHVQHSHFATVDVPATFFIALCLWLCVRALENDARRNLFLAALVAGFATATKYNAAIVLIAPLAAWGFLSCEKKISLPAIFAIIALFGAGFFIGCPFSVFDFQSFWGDGKNAGLAYELLVHPKQGHGDVFLETGNGWIYHAIFNAPFLMTWPLLIAAVIGFWSTPGRKEIVPKNAALVLLMWCAIYFFALGFSQVRFLRYLLPLAPALCVFVACEVLQLRRFGSTAMRASGVLLLVCAAWGARDVLYPFVAQDPRDQAVSWFNQNGKTPASVGMIGAPWYYSPPLVPLDSPPYRPLSAANLSALSKNRFQFIFTGLDARKLQIIKSRDQEPLPQWFIFSELEWRERARLKDAEFEKFIAVLNANYSLAARFKNESALLPGREFVPHDFLYTNPEIRIYGRKH